jgi:hypothetical protein
MKEFKVSYQTQNEKEYNGEASYDRFLNTETETIESEVSNTSKEAAAEYCQGVYDMVIDNLQNFMWAVDVEYSDNEQTIKVIPKKDDDGNQLSDEVGFSYYFNFTAEEI